MIFLRWTQVAGAILALGVAASGAGLIAQDGGKEPVEGPKPDDQPPSQAAPVADPPVIEVRPGKLRSTLLERGNLELSKSMDVLCEVEGTTTIIMIRPEGSVVKKGEVVAELDAATLRDRLVNQRIAARQAESAHGQARLALEVAEFAAREFVEGTLPQERSALKGRIDIARDDIERGRARLERIRRGRKRLNESSTRRPGAESPADVLADLTVDDRLDEVEKDIKAKTLELEAAQARRESLEKYTADKTTRQLTIQVERARMEELARESAWMLEQSKEKKFERQIERCTLPAPDDGVLVYANDPGRSGGQNRVQIEEGATVRERQKIFSVVNPFDPMRVNVKVREAYVDQLKPGQAVQIRVDAVPNEALTGVVRAIAPMADAMGLRADGVKVYTTLIQIDRAKPTLNLRPGMSASVEVLLKDLDGVLTVPTACLMATEPDQPLQTFAAVKGPGGGFAWRELTLGASNDEVVEVKAGLQPGDRVVRDPATVPGLDRAGKLPISKAYPRPARARPR